MNHISNELVPLKKKIKSCGEEKLVMKMEKVKNLNCSTRKFEIIRKVISEAMTIRHKIESKKNIFTLKHNLQFIMQLGKEKNENSTNPRFILFP